VSRILIVDDEPGISQLIAYALAPAGHELETADRANPAVDRIRGADYDLVITDVMMPDGDGFDVLAAARARPDPPDVIIITGFGSVESAVRAMKHGAAEYVTKPFDVARLAETVAGILAGRGEDAERTPSAPAAKAAAAEGDFAGMIGRSEPMHDLYARIEQVARADTTVLICGESGSGKELVARAIHARSGRSAGPFVAVDCGALTETLLEGELFGHVRGAFTGAVDDRTGLLEAADGGTVFLDEIGEMTPRVQQRLLRTIQERAVRPVGSTEERQVDVRILSATNRDLEDLIERDLFRRELYYRLNVVRLAIPPLGDRLDDVPLLAQHFAERTAARLGRRAPAIGRTVLEILRKAEWPGNVRQLENVVECAVTFAEGDEVRPEHLPPDFVESFALSGAPARDDLSAVKPGRVTPLGAAVRYLERQMLSKALDASDGNKEKAANMLGIDRATLYRKLKAHGLAKNA